MQKVTVIIPLYNKRQYIRRALDSVLAQTHRDFEVFVIDDGSTDGGAAIVESYHDVRLHLLHQENAGPGAARNRGIRESTGSYVTFLDADDEWVPHFLIRNIAILSAHPDVDVVTSSWFQDVLQGRRQDVNMVEYHRSLGIRPGVWRLRPDVTAAELKHVADLFLVGVVFCRRRALEFAGGFYEKDGCRYLEDTYLWLHLVFNHTIYRNLQPLAYYHNSVSELALGGFRTRPLEPFMVDPDPIRANCPPENRKALEKWLAMYALGDAHDRATVGRVEDARFLMRQFPRMKQWPWEFAKLQVKVLCPQAITYVQAVKRLVRRERAPLVAKETTPQ